MEQIKNSAKEGFCQTPAEFGRKISLALFKILTRIHLAIGTRKIHFFRKLFAVWVRNLKTDLAEIGGHKMFLDPVDSLALSIFGVHEPLETELVKKEIKNGDTVLDVGANIGYYTLIFARLVGKSGRVFAFEPDPDNFALLKKNVELNGYNNVTLVQKAVADKNGILNLYKSGRRGDHRIYNSHDRRAFVNVGVVKIDDFLDFYKKPVNFIKMDIQGAEGLVLRGMRNLLARNMELKIVMEFVPKMLTMSGVDPRIVLEELLSGGFELREIKEEKKTVIPANLENLLKPDTNTNLFCIRGNCGMPMRQN